MKRLIAIVDDDDLLRNALTSLISSHGYRAEAFSTAEEFLRAEMRAETGCLITDVNLPGMSGLDLYNELVRSGQHVPTIFITAYSDEKVRARALEMNECYFIKPFKEDELLACIREALES